jgi:hypothetical protein
MANQAGTISVQISDLQRKRWTIWLSSLTIFAVAVAWCHHDGIVFDEKTIAAMLFAYVIVALVAELCRITPQIGRFAVCLDGIGQLWIAAAAFAIIQYPAARLNFPLADTAIAAFDSALGFDWPRYADWVAVHPSLQALLDRVYHAYAVLTPFLAFAVGLRNPRRLQCCLIANLIGALTCAVLAALLPAVGAAGYFLPSAEWPSYVRSFLDARAGSVQTLNFSTIDGIEQFPSYHATMAILYAYGFMSLPRWAALPLVSFMGLMMVSALSTGSHHLGDVLAGALIGLSAVLIAERATERRQLFSVSSEPPQ